MGVWGAEPPRMKWGVWVAGAAQDKAGGLRGGSHPGGLLTKFKVSGPRPTHSHVKLLTRGHSGRQRPSQAPIVGRLSDAYGRRPFLVARALRM